MLFVQGQALRAAGRWREAIARLEAASLVNPDRPETLLSLGVLHLQQNEGAQALPLIERAVQLAPGSDQAWDALGLVHTALGEHLAAYQAFSRASAIVPARIPFRLRRAEAAVKCGKAEELHAIFEAELANPLDAAPLLGLGLLAIREHRLEAAIDFLEAAMALDDTSPEAPMLLGMAYTLSLRPERAAPFLALALRRDPENSTLVNDLAVTYSRLHRYEEAIELLNGNIARSGPGVVTLGNLAAAKAALGEMQDAAAAARAAIELAPAEYSAHRAFCNMLPYQEDVSPDFLLAAQQRTAALLPRPAPLPLLVTRQPERRLRVGLLSNLLRVHPAGWLTIAGLEALDAGAFSIHCFGRFDAADPLATRAARFAADWVGIEALDDAAAARIIRDARIDILIDLGGTGDTGRIAVCAYRPAPLQVKWVGQQFHSTGMPFMDYFVTDDRESPPGFDAFYSEKLLRLPDGYVCYLPPPYAPEVGKLPAQGNGFVTFGCLNNLMKLTPGTLRAWAEILLAVPDSRIWLRCPQFSHAGPRQRIGDFLGAHGVPQERVQFFPGSSHRDFLATYNAIDIALDPFPYSGGLSTCEALYMGVPVVTRAGEIFAARHSVSHLGNVGLQDWVACDTAEYVAKAIRRAGDLEALVRLRASLRQRVLMSPLCDAPRFGRNFGQALRQIWRDYCQN